MMKKLPRPPIWKPKIPLWKAFSKFKTFTVCNMTNLTFRINIKKNTKREDNECQMSDPD